MQSFLDTYHSTLHTWVYTNFKHYHFSTCNLYDFLILPMEYSKATMEDHRKPLLEMVHNLLHVPIEEQGFLPLYRQSFPRTDKGN